MLAETHCGFGGDWHSGAARTRRWIGRRIESRGVAESMVRRRSPAFGVNVTLMIRIPIHMSLPSRRRFVSVTAAGAAGVAAAAHAANGEAARPGLCTEAARDVPLTADALGGRADRRHTRADRHSRRAAHQGAVFQDERGSRHRKETSRRGSEGRIPCGHPRAHG